MWASKSVLSILFTSSPLKYQRKRNVSWFIYKKFSACKIRPCICLWVAQPREIPVTKVF